MRFLLIDRITELVPGSCASAIKSIALSEDFFSDHFPGSPVMPGVLILEGMAQLSGILLEETVEATMGRRVKALVAIVENAKFRHPVYPGDRLTYETRVLSVNETGGRISATAIRDGVTCAECRLVFCFREYANEQLDAKQREIVSLWTRDMAR